MSSGKFDLLDVNEHASSIMDEIGDSTYKPIGDPIRVYKFRQVSGYTIFTKSGEIPKYESLNELEQFANFKTGKEPITVVWEKSSNLKNSIESPNEFQTEFKVGSYELAYSLGSYANSIETIDKELFGVNFAVDIKTTKIQLESNTWIPDVNDQINYLYIIVDARYPSYQMLQLASYNLNYNDSDGSFVNAELSFENINLKYSSTGRQILDFIQFGSIGHGYAFPKEIILEDGSVETILDPIKLESDGVQSIQIDTNTTTGFKAPLVYGSPIGLNNIYNKPQRLFLLDSLVPVESDIFYTNQQMNYFFVEDGQPVYKVYVDSYKDNPDNPFVNLGSYNVGTEKKFLGGIQANNKNILDSNPIASSGKYQYPINSNDKWVTINKKYEIAKYVNGMQDVDGTETPIKMKITDCLNFMSYVDFYTDNFSYEVTDVVKFKVTDVLGIFGNIVNVIIGGLNLGFTNDTTINLSQPMNFFIATTTFNIGTAVRPLTQGGTDIIIPLESFSDKKEQSLFPMDNVQLCSFHFSLTDYIQDTSQSIPNAVIGKGGGNGIWNTKYIGQILDEDLVPLLPSGKMFNFNPRTTKAIPNPFNSNQRYIIDFITLKQIYSGDCRFSAYVKDIDIFTGEEFLRSVYSSIFSTTSKAFNKFRWLETNIKFNYWEEFNTIGSVPNTWPQLILPPSPVVLGDFIWMDEIKYQDPLFSSQSIASKTPITSKKLLTLPGTLPQFIDYDLMNRDIVFTGTYKATIIAANDDTKNYIDITSNDIDTLGIQSEPNQLRNLWDFNLEKYTDEQLVNFDRVAIQFASETGQIYWMKIPNVDFVKLKNQAVIYIEDIEPRYVFESTDKTSPIPVKSTSGYPTQEMQLSLESKFIGRSLNYQDIYTKKVKWTLFNENGKSSLQINAELNYRLKGRQVAPITALEYFSWTTKNIDIEVGIDREVHDYISSNSRIKILRVLLFDKDYDESSTITYIN